MAVPTTVQSLIEEGQQRLQSDPDAALDWVFRAQMYAEIEASEPSSARIVRARLALSAVQKVIPLLEAYAAGYWDDLLPQAMAVLTALVQGKADPVEANEVEDHMYHATGNWAMMYEDDPDYPLVPGKYSSSADFAAMALYKALGEANGKRISPFGNLGSFRQVGTVTLPSNIQGSQFTENRIPGKQLSESAMAGLAGTGDTAGAAAMAYALDDAQTKISRERLIAFWQWWLGEAIAEAYCL